MKSKFRRKMIACAVSAALVVGGIPVYSSNKAAAAGSEGQGILVEAEVINGSSSAPQIKFSAKSVSGSYTFDWYVGKNKSDIENNLTCKNADTFNMLNSNDLTSDGNGYILVKAKEDPNVKSRVLEVKSYALEVDALSGVTLTDASAGASDGMISVSTANNDMQYMSGNSIATGTPLDFNQWKLENLKAGDTYSVMYKDSIMQNTVLKKGLYAVYTVGTKKGTDASAAPSTDVPGASSPSPTAVPVPSYNPSTSVPVYTEKPVVKPTETPVVTEEPAATPAVTEEPDTEPTGEPVVTEEPAATPAVTEEPDTEPTEEPVAPAETLPPTQAPEKTDLSEPGTEVVVGNQSYKSTGTGSVSYAGSRASSVKTVTVPDQIKVDGKSYPVTKIEADAFNAMKVETVKMGKNVIEIGKRAFKNCKRLKKIDFSPNIKTVGNEAFSGCTKVKSVKLPSSVRSVGARAFKNCKALKKFTIGKKPVKAKKGNIMFGGPATKISIGANALENCVALRRVIINSQVTKIGNSTFKNCKKLAEILVRSLMLKKVGGKALTGVNNCKISVPTVRLKKYRTLFKNKGQGKKVVIAKV